MTGSAVESLVEELLAMRQRIGTQLTQAFDGVPEKVAGRHPTSDAWSMKDVLAHLVINERQNVAWIAEMVRLENPSLIDVFTETLSQKIAAVRAVAPHSLALLSHLQRAVGDSSLHEYPERCRPGADRHLDGRRGDRGGVGQGHRGPLRTAPEPDSGDPPSCGRRLAR